MVHVYIKEPLLLLGVWIVFIQIRFWFRWRALETWGQKNGCEECPVVKNKLPWGLDRYLFLFNGQLSSKSSVSLR
jgi:hypothetical protein